VFEDFGYRIGWRYAAAQYQGRIAHFNEMVPRQGSHGLELRRVLRQIKLLASVLAQSGAAELALALVAPGMWCLQHQRGRKSVDYLPGFGHK